MMMITKLGLFLSLLLLLVPGSLFFLASPPQCRRLSFAFGRMLLQMGIVAAYTWALFRFDSPWLNVVWLLLMSLVSAWVVVERARLVWSRLYLPVVGSTFLTVLLLTTFMLLVVLRPAHGFQARWFVPVAGVLLAHTLISNTRSLSAFYEYLKVNVLDYEVRLTNGVPHWKALLPFVGHGLQTVMGPAAAQLSVTGMFALPMLLSGLLLGGMSPIDAAVLTVVLIATCLTASVLSLLLTVLLADRRTFDRRGNFLDGSHAAVQAVAAGCVCLLVLTACGGSGQSKPAEAQQQDAEVSTFYDGAKARPAADGKDAATSKVYYEQPAKLTDRPEQIIRRVGYTVSYNATTKTANWVAWHLTKAHTYGRNQRSQEQFTEDKDVAAPRATDQDYYNSRFDRGHLCPAGDNKWDATAMSQSFLFTNICPQNHGLNKYEWNDLEMLCREWAQQYGAIDIVCGPIFDHPENQKTIGRNKVWVPDRLFKVVMCRSGEPKAIGFIYRNEGKKQPMEKAVCTVDEVERLTGIDFFPALADAVEDRIEASARLADW